MHEIFNPLQPEYWIVGVMNTEFWRHSDMKMHLTAVIIEHSMTPLAVSISYFLPVTAIGDKKKKKLSMTSSEFHVTLILFEHMAIDYSIQIGRKIYMLLFKK